MIKIKTGDSIIDIISKIINCEEKNIILEFPFWHLVLHNYLSLKILKNKANRKELIIVTTDLTSKKIWESLWIKYSIIKNSDFIKEKNILKYNYSFFEYFKFEVKKHFIEFKSFILKNKKLNSIKKYEYKHTWLWFFIAILWISTLLLLFIFYFTVNKTYIYITPEIEVKTKSKNFVFKVQNNDSIENTSKIIKLKEISLNISLKEKYKTSWINENNIKKASWKAKLINKTNENIKLVTKTRLQTWSWLIYEIIWDSFIPKARIWTWKTIIAWETIVNIISKIKDINWRIIWQKWNIKSWVFLSIPWLKDIKNNIYARSYGKIKWWITPSNKIVSKKDIKNAKKFFEERLKKYALNKLKTKIIKNNKINKTFYNILSVNNIIKYNNLNIKTIWDIKAWQIIDYFELQWNINIKTYTYNEKNVINKLRNTIKDLSLEEIENILLIDEKSLRVSNVIYKIEKPFSIKATMEVEVYYSQNFLSKNNWYIDRLKWNILWINKDDAKKILLNNLKISNVQIETRPFFIKNISNIPNNIVFKIQDE